MRAMILAAGLGTRLLPITAQKPKPLLPVSGAPVLERVIRSLEKAGVDGIAVNTHHLADQISAWLAGRKSSVPLVESFEPRILGSGGGVKKMEDFLRPDPFIVVNADLVTDFDFRSLMEFHQSHDDPVTLAIHDYPKFNNVCVEKGLVAEFSGKIGPGKMAFTGIQALDPGALDYFDAGKFQSSITAYKRMIDAGLNVRAFTPKELWWHDMGSFEGYSRACLESGAAKAFGSGQSPFPYASLDIKKLAGGGSERKWFRIESNEASIVAVDHGIRPDDSWNEADAYDAIGRHLDKTRAPVPKILYYDQYAGIVFAEDLGDESLEKAYSALPSDKGLALYEQVVKNLASMALKGAEGFDPSWTFQTREYDRDLIIEKESKYFIEAFVNNYLGKQVKFHDLEPEFQLLARKTVENAPRGFLHRDFQSRNIMIKDGRGCFIDFQGGRTGPLAYDLASLLIDPYVSLPHSMQDHLFKVYLKKLEGLGFANTEAFLENYPYCALHRNLQMLGAFAHLTQTVKKTGSEEFIKPAVHSLKNRIQSFDDAPLLKSLIHSL